MPKRTWTAEEIDRDDLQDEFRAHVFNEFYKSQDRERKRDKTVLIVFTIIIIALGIVSSIGILQ